jgi:hypothetical protein
MPVKSYTQFQCGDSLKRECDGAVTLLNATLQELKQKVRQMQVRILIQYSAIGFLSTQGKVKKERYALKSSERILECSLIVTLQLITPKYTI